MKRYGIIKDTGEGRYLSSTNPRLEISVKALFALVPCLFSAHIFHRYRPQCSVDPYDATYYLESIYHLNVKVQLTPSLIALPAALLFA